MCWRDTTIPGFDQGLRPTTASCYHGSFAEGSADSTTTNTHFHIDVNNTCRCIPVSRGVRQGCSIAPYLWAATMALLLDDLQTSIPRQWILDNITFFADGIHVFCLFKNSRGLCLAVHYFEKIIAAIERLGLTLTQHCNPTACHVYVLKNLLEHMFVFY